MLNIHELRVFHTVVQCHGVVRAAEALFISQPAVSNALRRLQKNHGIRLFVRDGRSLVLTPSGEALHALTTRLFAVEQDISTLLRQEQQLPESAIHLGLVTIYERFAAADICNIFLQTDKSVTISIHSGNSRSLMEQLAAEDIDLAIVGGPAPGADFIRHFYKRHEVRLVIPRGHRLFGSDRFNPADLAGERMVLKEPGSSVRQVVDAFFKTHGLNPPVVSELSNFEANMEIMLKEKYLGFFPDMAIENVLGANPSFSTARPDGECLYFSTWLTTRRMERYAEAQARFIQRLLARFSPESPS